MLAAMLASHSMIAAGPETQFFSKLSGDTLNSAVKDIAWPHKAVEQLMSLTLADQNVATLFGTNAAGLRAFLQERDPDIAAMLEALVLPFAKEQGKRRWAEKTPNHIQNLKTIRALWPDAAIIRIIRDPRDVGLSTRKLPTFSNAILPNIYVWQQWNAHAEAFLESDALSITVRYEDIIDDAATQLHRICKHIDEEFEPGMVQFQQSAADVSSANESWKIQVSDELTNSRKYAWKSDLPSELRQICDFVCHELLVKHGYEYGQSARDTRTAFRLSRGYVERHEKALIRDAANGVRWMPAEMPDQADRITDQPQYARFRNPVMMARLIMGKIAALRERRG